MIATTRTSLRRRLTLLLAVSALFAVVASFAIIQAIRLHVGSAAATFQRSMAQSTQVDQLLVDARDQVVKLREVSEGWRAPNESYSADRDAFFLRLDDFARFAPARLPEPDREDLLRLSRTLREEFDRCLQADRGSSPGAARQMLDERMEHDLLAALESRLQGIRGRLDEFRDRSVDDLAATNNLVLILAAVVGAGGAGLVVVGAALVRRWLIVPISQLQRAVEEFGKGNLERRVRLDGQDELGALGDSFNAMATSLVKAQSDLRTSEAKYRSLFENLRDAVVICDSHARVVEFHDGDAGLLGCPAQADLGRPVLDVWPHWRSGAIDWPALLDRVIGAGAPYRTTDAALGTGGGEPGGIVDVLAYPVAYASERFAAIVLRDVTERHRLEQQARRTEAMEATVTLARGIAHDFNNLLTSATATLSFLEPVVNDPKQREQIRSASRACWQAAALASRLVNFASTSEGHPQVFCLKEMVDLILGSLDPTFLGRIRVQCACDDSVLVKMDRDQLTQVILNLIRNAGEAMPDGGDLRISVESRTVRPPTKRGPPADYATLVVADTGCGMSPEVRRRIFEPFFTTKGRGAHRGRGMGLAVVYAVVKNAGGFIHVDSRPGAGSQFTVHLPLGKGAAEPLEPQADIEPIEVGAGAILVVEDDPAMLQTCAEAFEKWGYSVVTADCVAEAQACFRAGRNGGFDLAVIDMHLPDGDGVELARDLLQSSPNLHVVFTTGFAETTVPPELGPRACARLLKPFRMESLARTVAAALQHSPIPPRGD